MEKDNLLHAGKIPIFQCCKCSQQMKIIVFVIND